MLSMTMNYDYTGVWVELQSKGCLGTPYYFPVWFLGSLVSLAWLIVVVLHTACSYSQLVESLSNYYSVGYLL